MLRLRGYSRWETLFAAMLCFDPAFLCDLSRPSYRQRVSRDVICNARRSSNVGAFTKLYRSNQSRVATDKNSVFDSGLVLIHAVVIAGDGSSADVYVLADLSIAEIREVVCLRFLAQADFFSLNEVANVCAFSDVTPGAKM